MSFLTDHSKLELGIIQLFCSLILNDVFIFSGTPFKRLIPLRNDRRESCLNVLERLTINMALKLWLSFIHIIFAMNSFKLMSGFSSFGN
uniref:Uncharacterized protein n=1 Tax=Parascaris equorum TaxID=6256 RepID=A0A914RRR1_PAREQ